MPKSRAYLQTMTKEPAKFQIDQYKTVWGVAHLKGKYEGFNSTKYLRALQ